MKIKQLDVHTPQGYAGALLRESQFVFNYDTTDTTCEVSLTMPLRARSYSANVLPPVFSMSLPEGYLAQRIIQRLAKFEQVDDMRLLAATGHNAIGRPRCQVPGQEPDERKADVGLRQLLSERATKALFDHLLEQYLDAGISGVQPKVMIPDADKLVDARTTLWQPDLIVKSGGDEYPWLAVNEYLCMDAARRAGLDVPEFWLSDDGTLFVMERFDLDHDRHLGFEDMAVLMNQPREPTGRYKYRQSYEAVTRFIAAYCRENATESLQRFYAYLAVSVMVRNGDAHLKNFGLLYDHPRAASPRLAPLYDVVTTSAYDDLNMRTGAIQTDRTLALKLNKSHRYPDRAELLAFGRDYCRVSSPENVVDRIGQAMSEAWAASAHRLPADFARRLHDEWDDGRYAVARAR